MAYTPDPTDVTNPTDATSAETAQAEFRALKAYLAANLAVISGGNLGGLLFKDNLLINGEMNIWQRGAGGTASFAAPATATYLADKWRIDYSGAGRVTVAQIAGMDQYSPFSMQITVTTPSGALGAGDFYTISQRVIASKAGRLGWGNGAAAKTVSASFLASFNTAGIHTFFIQNGAQNRTFAATINVLPAQVGVPTLYQIPGIPGDVAGVWPTGTSAIGVIAGIVLAAGSNFTSANHNVWQAGNLISTTGAVNELATNAAVVKLGRIRFTDESGCSPFVQKSFDDDLWDCLPYFEKTFSYATAPASNIATFVGCISISQTVGAGAVQNGNYVAFKRPKISNAAALTFFDPQAAGAGVWNSSTASSASVPGIQQQSQNGFSFNFTSSGGSGGGNGNFVNYTADADL